jgi:hypothetical protein
MCKWRQTWSVDWNSACILFNNLRWGKEKSILLNRGPRCVPVKGTRVKRMAGGSGWTSK